MSIEGAKKNHLNCLGLTHADISIEMPNSLFGEEKFQSILELSVDVIGWFNSVVFTLSLAYNKYIYSYAHTHIYE